MTELRPGLPPLPSRMRALPLDARGYPVPWFVAWIDGKPDFRVIGEDKIPKAINGNLCWLCGEALGRNRAFVIGPMCAINRISSEPPSHLECATFAATACPFLVRPAAKRREGNMPTDTQEAAGLGLKRNPGVALVWVTRSWRWFRQGHGVLCEVGDPVSVHWFAEGRQATRAEVDESIRTGLPSLVELAELQPGAMAHLDKLIARAAPLLPA